jgi:hypothetical protein
VATQVPDPAPADCRLQIGSKVFVLSDGAVLESAGLSPEFAGRPFASVSAHPDHPEILGLKNLTGRRWTARTQQGEVRGVEPNRTLKIVPGMRIDFGPVNGDILRPCDEERRQAIRRFDVEQLALRLRRAAKRGVLTEAQYRRLHLSFYVRDSLGRAWTVGLESGGWSRSEAGRWTADAPPADFMVSTELFAELSALADNKT